MRTFNVVKCRGIDLGTETAVTSSGMIVLRTVQMLVLEEQHLEYLGSHQSFM